MRIVLALLVSWACALPAHALELPPPSAKEVADMKRVHRLALKFAAGSDVRKRLLFAPTWLAEPWRDRSTEPRLAPAAALVAGAAGSTDPTVLFMAYARCGLARDCDPLPWLERAAQVDPDNAYYWLTLAGAYESKDAAKADAAFDRALGSSDYRSSWTPMLAIGADAMRRAKSEEERADLALLAFGTMPNAVISTHWVGPFVRRCGTDPKRDPRCDALVDRLIARADDLLTLRIAASRATHREDRPALLERVDALVAQGLLGSVQDDMRSHLVDTLEGMVRHGGEVGWAEERFRRTGMTYAEAARKHRSEMTALIEKARRDAASAPASRPATAR